MKAEIPYLSVIIPAYNEQTRIADSLYIIKEYLAKQSYRSEIIVVDDGSNDLTTEIVKFIDIYGKEQLEHDEGTLIENQKNVGKGYSIAKGMLRASGDIVLFLDADHSTHIGEIEKLIPYFDLGFDVAIGSRNMKTSIVEKKPWYRLIFSCLCLCLFLCRVSLCDCFHNLLKHLFIIYISKNLPYHFFTSYLFCKLRVCCLTLTVCR